MTLTKEQRKTAPRLRDGEHAILHKVLDVVDMKPALFESLAEQDEGMDPNRLETALLRERIEKHLLFSETSPPRPPRGGPARRPRPSCRAAERRSLDQGGGAR
ncbi:hypothetical protein [Sorangium sp. So ce117]|uniref:hypothetical protein n=1 Tax=Sorangium sp. So ce117 TaxID=3133277 RepID=UPI003F604432